VISHHQRTILTYDALDRGSNKLARGLHNIGVKKGDRVAVSLGNNVEFATVWSFAIAADGRGLTVGEAHIRAVQARSDFSMYIHILLVHID
jgi:non-ribosomal peptide synthetase component E (peptide arylation enzyme)